MNLLNKKILIVGGGISGIAAAKLCYDQNAEVILYDGNDKLEKNSILELLEGRNKIEIILGVLPEQVIAQTELLVLSPGVPTDLEFINKIRDKGVPVWGEIELAYQYSKGKIAAITGTNGKTTTTALVGEIMKTYYDSVFVVGNIGIPYTEMVNEMKDDSVTVAEMSSFQLETIKDFKPNVSAILNITPDHLNRHYTMENYIAAKRNIAKNQTKKETCVLNYEDAVLRELGGSLKASVIYFSSRRKLDHGIYLEGEEIRSNLMGGEETICSIRELKLLGLHNYENVMAATAIAISLSVPMECIRKAIISFKAVEHRIEYVTTVNEVTYYNDSKGTNPDAAIKGIEAMVSPTLLIGGGYDKNSEYDDWIRSFQGKVKYLILLGQTKDKIAEAAIRLGFLNIIMVSTLEEAVQICASKAEPGDSVLLSPACASWGMFPNYEERGRIFKELVNQLAED